MSSNSVCLVFAVCVLIAPAYGGVFESGSDGSDGALDCDALNCPAGCDENNPCTVFFGLNGASTATWNTPSPNPGLGVYDPQQWAVVFKFTTIDIPAGVTVKFDNHEKGAPVVWLATGDVTIAGTLMLDGADGTTSADPGYSRPGPGGFSGGIVLFNSLRASGGFGPGGGNRGVTFPSSGGYGTAGQPGSFGPAGGVVYGNSAVMPIVGGSGGGGIVNSNGGGGAGGGAIVVASSGTILLRASGEISARGGGLPFQAPNVGAPGSGGGIRLIANEISGAGFMRADGGTGGSATPGGDGRIRLEAGLNSLDRANVTPQASESGPSCVFSDPSQTPSLRVTSVDNRSVPADPSATILTNDVTIATVDPVVLRIEARNVPADTETLFVTIRVVPEFGNTTEYQSETPLVGSFSLSTTTAVIAFSNTRTEVVLRIDTP